MNKMNKVSAIVRTIGVVAALAAGHVRAADLDQPGLHVDDQASKHGTLALGDRVQSFWNGVGDQLLPGVWSARLDSPASRLTASTWTWTADTTRSDGLNLQRAALGNIYFSRFAGVRATGGVLGVSRTTVGRLLASGGSNVPLNLDRPVSTTGFDGPAQALPYLGLGYSSRWLTGSTSAAATWGVSADLGLMAASPRSAVRLGQQGLDDTLRELRVAPMLQFGVSYIY